MTERRRTRSEAIAERKALAGKALAGKAKGGEIVDNDPMGIGFVDDPLREIGDREAKPENRASMRGAAEDPFADAEHDGREPPAARSDEETPLVPDGEELSKDPTDDADAYVAKEIVFATANGLKQPTFSTDFERVVRSVYAVDVWGEYQRLERSLSIGEQRGDYGIVNRGLDEAEDNARMAFQIFLAAKVERARLESEVAVVMAAMRTEASDHLQQEKDKGTRAKAITDADVVAKMAELHPDEHAELEDRRTRAKGLESQCEKLADLWTSRCRSLGTMLAMVRK